MGAFKCPYCSAPDSEVAESRGGRPYRRVRKCLTCRKRFNTLESHISSEVDEYIGIISGLASEKMVDVILGVLNSEPLRKVLKQQLIKTTGGDKGFRRKDSAF